MNSDERSQKDCATCQSNLTAVDTDYPLLCPSRCRNVCFHCLSNLYDSTQICPECQMSVSETIKDTIFMRNIKNLNLICDDSELSAAELRMKYNTTKNDIQKVENRLQNFMSGKREKFPIAKDDGIGVVGSDTLDKSVDTSLLSGMEKMLSLEEQAFITNLFTSGEPSKLAQAARILYELRIIKTSKNFDENNTRPMELMSIGNPFQKLHSEVSAMINQQVAAAEQRILDVKSEINKTQSFEERNETLPPLPKYVVLEANFDIYARYQKMLKVKDDVWDGSLADAFARRFHNSSDHKSDNDSDSDSDHDSRSRNASQTSSVAKNRVVVTAARRLAYSAGIREGDVITHFNDEEFHGNARELKDLIHDLYLSSQSKDLSENSLFFTMTLNADKATANALKQRSSHQLYSP